MSEAATDIDLINKTIDQTIFDKPNRLGQVHEHVKDLSSECKNFITEAVSPINGKESPSKAIHINEKKIFEIGGNVLDFDENVVKISLENGLTINFPVEIFNNSQLLKYGQAIKYLIKSDSSGYRYQEFLEDTNTSTASQRELLDFIKSI